MTIAGRSLAESLLTTTGPSAAERTLAGTMSLLQTQPAPTEMRLDYDKRLISKGGGVFSRSLKEIPLSPQVRALLGIENPAIDPDGLMHVMNYPNDWSSRYETGPPGDRVSNVINDNIRILGHPPHQQWCFQMYPESSSPSDDLKAVNNFLLL